MSYMLLPYEFIDECTATFPKGYYARKTVSIDGAFIVWSMYGEDWHHVALRMPSPTFKTKEAAMAALDAIIIEDGHTILNESQAKTIELLL